MKLTVRELVAFGRFPYSGRRLNAEDEKLIDKAIEYMELEEFEDRFIDELSGGQRQRAYIAMVIAQDTEYVLLDEPTNNLDIYHATNMMKIVRRLCDELGKTVVLVLHEINYAAFYSDYICAFVGGMNIMKKQLLTMILSAVMVSSLAACSGSSDSDSGQAQDGEAATEDTAEGGVTALDLMLQDLENEPL